MVSYNSKLLLEEALQKAFMERKATSIWQIQGVSRVEPVNIENLADRLYALALNKVPYGANYGVTVTMDGAPSKEIYLEALSFTGEEMSKNGSADGHSDAQLTIIDMTNAPLNRWLRRGNIKYVITSKGGPGLHIARVSYTPKTPVRHEVAIYARDRNNMWERIEFGSVLLANYLLRQNKN